MLDMLFYFFAIIALEFFMFIFQAVIIISCMLCILCNISCYFLQTIVSLVG